jgi:WD40 repeat protein
VWDTASGECLLEHDSDNGGWSVSGAFTREGAVLIGKYESLELWDIEKDKRIWKGHDPGMDWQGVTILSADGSHVFTGGNYKNQVRVWERETGKLLHKFDGHYGNVSRLAACPDNTRIASIGRDDNVRIWDYKTGKPLTVIPFTDSRPQATAWTPDGAALIVATTDGSVRRYDPENGKELRRSVGHLGPVTAVAVGGGSVFTAGLDGTIRKWDSNIEKEILPARPAYPDVKLVFTDEDRELLAVPQFGKPVTYHLLDSSPSEVPWTGPDIYPISLSATGGTILGRTRDWQLVVGDLTTGNVVPVEQLQAKDTTRFTLSPNGKRCLAVGSQSVDWVELPTGAAIHRLTDWSGEPAAGAVSNDGGLGAVVSKDGNVTIWDLKSGKTVRAASLSKEDGTMLLFGADGRKLYVFGRSETVWEMDVVGDTEPTGLEPHGVTPRCAATAPDNKRIATATNNGEIVIRTLGMTRPRILKAPHPVTALAFSVDGRLLAAALGNGTIALYRVGP